MSRKKVIFIAQNQPLDTHTHLRKKLTDAENRAKRQSHRFPDLDLLALQKEVHHHILENCLFMEGRYMDLLDVVNFVKNGRRMPVLTSENANQHYSLANTVTLNGIYMYQYLERHGYEPVVVQNHATCDLSQVLTGDPLAVCISSNFIFMNDIREMAREIKALAPDIPVVAGGMLVKKVLHAGERFSQGTLNYLSRFHPHVDAFVVEAKGEQTLIKLLRTFENGGSLDQVPNVAYFDAQGSLRFTPRLAEDIPMDDTAIRWDLVPKAYLRNTLPVNSSRGCAYRCRFCTYHWLFPQVHFKSIDVLKKELEAIDALGFVRHIRFTDDNFTARKERLKAVLEMMIREGFGFTWSSFARASALTPDLVRLMKRSGCEFLDLGLESGSQRILDNMDKRLAVDQSREAIKMLNDAGIVSRGSFIIGYPGETSDTFSETVEFINGSGLPYYHPYLFYYTGNTLVHRQRDDLGLKGLGLAWRHHTMDSGEAAGLMAQMIEKIHRSYTDGQAYVEEIYKLLRGEGFSPHRIESLFRLKRDLLLTIKGHSPVNASSEEAQALLSRMEALIC
ncbi:MAG: radical SAM protein [Deltaproteobacteria bacterium]|nr:radical SAM protein [Deltaproteobacteria bacterium]